MRILIRAGNNDKDQSRFKRKFRTKQTKREKRLFTEAYGEKTDNGLFTEAYEEKPITGFSRRLTEKKPKRKRTKEKN